MATAVLQVTSEQLGINQGEECDRQLDFDLGNLTAVYPSALEEPGLASGSDQACKDVATKVTQSLIRQLFSLTSHLAPEGRIVELPHPVLVLPRAKPVPKPKPLTKWEKFAKEKGIHKRKRSSLVFDENSQDWKRRHGYDKGNDAAAVPIIEASAADKDGEDPFTRLERERKERVKQNKRNETKNMVDAEKAGALPSTVKLSTKLDANSVRGQIAKGKALKGDIQNASYLAGVSTASMGKFDKRLRGEKGERKLPGLRKKHLPAEGASEEQGVVKKVMGKIFRRGEEDLVNVRRAVGNFEAQKREERAASGEDGEDRKRKKGRVGRVKNRRVPKKPLQPSGGVKKGGKGVSKGAAKGGKGSKGKR